MGFADYAPTFADAEQQYNLPPGTLGGLAWQESRFNPQAVGSSGEQGMFQFMPKTAQGVGLSNPFDPKASAYAAANLLHQNLQATGGDMNKALMMYNGGTNQSNWNPSYASSVLSHARQFAQPQPSQGYPPSGGQPPMPLSLPSARPLNGPNQGQNASLGALANQQQPINVGAAPDQVQTPSLGQMAASLPQGNIPKPSKFTAGNILGVLGDALSAYGGRQPTFGPFLQEQKMMQAQHDFEMQKYQQQIGMQLAMMRSGLDTDLGKKLVASGVQPGTPQWQNAMATSTANELDPTVNTAQGPVLRSSVVQATQPPAAAIARLKSDLARGDQSALTEFEQYYGPGSSIRALGAQ